MNSLLWCLALNQRQIATGSNILLLCLSNLFFKFYIVRKLAVSQQCCDNSRDVGRGSILWRLMVVLKKKWLNCFPCSTPSDLKQEQISNGSDGRAQKCVGFFID